MYSSFPQFALGFHGCDKKVGQAIIAGKSTLIPSKNVYDWLGSGIYFWENAPERAMTWAKECASKPTLTKGTIFEPFVVGALIDLGNCLNLTNTGYSELLKVTYQLLADSYQKAGLPLPQNKDKAKLLDCLVINATLKRNQDLQHSDFDTVRGAFIEGEPIYPGAALYLQTHIQICVRNPNCIKGYFNPLLPNSAYKVP